MTEYFKTCTALNAIEQRGESWTEPMSYLSGTTGIGGVATINTMHRVHTPILVEYIGLDLRSAKAYVKAHPSGTTYDSEKHLTKITKSRWERDGDGYYKVVQEIETITDWAVLEIP